MCYIWQLRLALHRHSSHLSHQNTIALSACPVSIRINMSTQGQGDLTLLFHFIRTEIGIHSHTGFSPSPTSSVDKCHWLISQHWLAFWWFHMQILKHQVSMWIAYDSNIFLNHWHREHQIPLISKHACSTKSMPPVAYTHFSISKKIGRASCRERV